MSRNCKYCKREFRFVDEYNSHMLGCEYFYRKHRAQDLDSGNDVVISALCDTCGICPSGKYQTKEQIMHDAITSMSNTINLQNETIRRILSTLEKCSVKIQRLESASNSRGRTFVSDVVKSADSPVFTLDNWISSISVNPFHIEIVLNNNLFAGILQCLEDALNVESVNSCPLRVFTHKKSAIYMYNYSKSTPKSTMSVSSCSEISPIARPEWLTMSKDHIRGILLTMSNLFISKQMELQKSNKRILECITEDNRQNVFNISFSSSYTTRIIPEFKEWLYNKVSSKST
jgi:hypothetical protein